MKDSKQTGTFEAINRGFTLMIVLIAMAGMAQWFSIYDMMSVSSIKTSMLASQLEVYRSIDRDIQVAFDLVGPEKERGSAKSILLKAHMDRIRRGIQSIGGPSLHVQWMIDLTQSEKQLLEGFHDFEVRAIADSVSVKRLEKLDRALLGIQALVRNNIQVGSLQLNQRTRRSLWISERAFYISGFALIASLLVCVVTHSKILEKIRKPIQILMDAVHQVTSGNRSLNIPTDSHDEIGELISSFNTMTSKLEESESKLFAHEKLLEAKIREATEALQTRANTDTLTGVGTFGFTVDRLQKEMELAKEHKKTLAVIMLDLDDLRKMNNKFGHEVGNRYLETFAHHLSECVGSIDTVGRYGGDEFLVVLPQGEDRIKGVVEALTKRLEHARIKIKDGDSIPIRFTYGVAVYPRDGKLLTELIENADSEMYRVKRQKKKSSLEDSPVQV